MWGRSFALSRSFRIPYRFLGAKSTSSRSLYSLSLFGIASSKSRVSHRPFTSTSRQLVASNNVQEFFHGGSEKGEETIVTYITDVEGDKEYLDRYVETSKILTFVESTDPRFPYQQCIDFLHPRAMLVFGGDIWDKGGHDLYTIRQLIDLQKRYPDRVIFILGNRDVNKLRILQEIGLREPPPYHPGLRWFRGSGKVGDPDSNPPPVDSVERLKWMFSRTMGSPDAFEHRRRELQWELSEWKKLSTPETVSDRDVVESYRSSSHPKGELGQFMAGAQFICQLGPLLFVHGSLPLISEQVAEKYQQGESIWDDLTFCMPWLPPGETAKDHGVSTIEEWMVALNAFCHRNVKEWQLDIARIEANGGQDDAKDSMWAREAGYHFGPPYSDLIQYGMGMLPGGKKNPTVVYNTFTPSGMPRRFYPDTDEPHMVQATKEFFGRTQIQLILAGHKPQGDMPSPIRVDESSWVLLGDTSYSGETIWHHHSDHEDDEEAAGTLRRKNLGLGNAKSFRGEVAVSEILIQLKGGTLESVTYHGVLSDGTEYETVNMLTHGKNTTIGQVAPEHLVPSELDSPHQGRWWTKSIFSDGSHLFHAGEGFNIWNFMTKPLSSKSTTTT